MRKQDGNMVRKPLQQASYQALGAEVRGRCGGIQMRLDLGPSHLAVFNRTDPLADMGVSENRGP